jgi:hypothetical protein
MSQSVSDTPRYSIHRSGVTVIDPTPSDKETEASNFSGFDIACFQVIPSGGASPTVEVMEWSEIAGSFISANPKFIVTTLGVDTPYAFTVTAAGRKLWVMVTAIVGGSVDIYAAGRQTGRIS